jgi:hypothetical protein
MNFYYLKKIKRVLILLSKSKIYAQILIFAWEKAKLDKKRLVLFREPPEKNKFENSIIKILTGGGKFFARNLYENKTEKVLYNTTFV